MLLPLYKKIRKNTYHYDMTRRLIYFSSKPAKTIKAITWRKSRHANGWCVTCRRSTRKPMMSSMIIGIVCDQEHGIERESRI